MCVCVCVCELLSTDSYVTDDGKDRVTISNTVTRKLGTT